LTVEEVLAWADEHFARTGSWPHTRSGPVGGRPGLSWLAVDSALRQGLRGLPGGDSLARLLARERAYRNPRGLLPLAEEQLVRWAQEHRRRTGSWPTAASGPVAGAAGETWRRVDQHLRYGGRGLPGGDSLAGLLARCCGGPPPRGRRRLSVEEVLSWADSHRERTGRWPTAASGPVADAPGETWSGVHHALRSGYRGLPGGTSLPQLLAQRRGKRNKSNLPRLTAEQVLEWADGHYQRTGAWPTVHSGAVLEAPEEQWRYLDVALRHGFRGLPGGDSLARLLRRERGVRPWSPRGHQAVGRREAHSGS
jgi:hypothetical protein